ncbi:MAG: protein TolR [Proteobacteria bacterium]|nr:protein TolR [Pseudomonadota bacterium]
MAFTPGGDHRTPLSEINVTPLVDVMLVLLIIFMVTAPMMMEGMDVKLPQVDSSAIQTEGERLVITVNAQGEIFLDEFKVPIEDLNIKIKRILDVRASKQVYLRADKSIPYGQVAKIMSEVRRAGVTNLGLVTEPEQVIRPDKTS